MECLNSVSLTVLKTSISKKPQLRSLTGLRFFLAIWVVIYHQTLPPGGMLSSMIQNFPPIVQAFLRTGYAPVSVFFVLSGFVLAYSYSLETPFSGDSFRKFAVARFARIYPGYFCGLLLMIPFVLPASLKGLSVLDMARAPLSLLMLQSWIPETAISWNRPGWSISVEMLFYLSFPILGVSLWKLRDRTAWLIAAAVIWCFSLLFPLWSVFTSVHDFGNVSALVEVPIDNHIANFIRFHPLVRLPEFCFGILLARIYAHLKSEGHSLIGRGYLLYMPAISVDFVAIANASRIPHPLLHNGLLLPVYGMLILGLALGGGAIDGFLSHPVIEFAGAASYSTYILHAPISCWFPLVYFLGLMPVGILATCLYLVALLAITGLFYHYVEQPVNILLKQALSAGRTKIDAQPLIIKTTA